MRCGAVTSSIVKSINPRAHGPVTARSPCFTLEGNVAYACCDVGGCALIRIRALLGIRGRRGIARG